LKKLQTTIVEPTGQEHFIECSILQGWRSKKPSFSWKRIICPEGMLQRNCDHTSFIQ